MSASAPCYKGLAIDHAGEGVNAPVFRRGNTSAADLYPYDYGHSEAQYTCMR